MSDAQTRVIVDATFGAARHGVRALRFVPRAAIPIDAACLVARRVGETLRELLGEECELVLGEPVAIDAQAWSLLAREALLFVTRGRATDVVLLLPLADARRLVLRAFGERDPLEAPVDLPTRAWSALEMHALERIAARCAQAFEPLSAIGAHARRAAVHEVPACSAYFDLRVRSPLPLSLGIGIVRGLPPATPTASLAPAALGAVALDARAVFAEGSIDAADFMRLGIGDVVRLQTKVGAPASLNCGPRRVASGIAGAAGSRAAFLVSALGAGAS